MGSAHCLTEMTIQIKFNENHSKGSGDMESPFDDLINVKYSYGIAKMLTKFLILHCHHPIVY